MDRTQELVNLLSAEQTTRSGLQSQVATLTASNASLTAQVADLQNQLTAAQSADTIGPAAIAAMQAEEAVVEPAAPAPATT